MEKIILKRKEDGAVLFEGDFLSVADAVEVAIGKGVDLTGVDLEGADLSGADFSGASMEKACLKGAYLRCTYFFKANLEGANLSGAYLEGADLSGSWLSGANLKKADLEDADLRGTRLSGVCADGACLRDVRFAGCSMDDASFRGADLRGLRAYKAEIRYSDFVGANLEGADFEGADLSGSDFSDANLTDVSFVGADLEGVDFSGANLGEARCYLVETRYVGPNRDENIDEDYLEICLTPPITNSSREVRIEGWCGTTNDWSLYGRGEYNSLDEAIEAAREQGYFREFPEMVGGDVLAAFKSGKYIPMSASDTVDWAYESITEVTAATTDEEITAMVDECEGYANDEGYTLTDLEDAMRKRRAELQEEEDDVEDEDEE